MVNIFFWKCASILPTAPPGQKLKWKNALYSPTENHLVARSPNGIRKVRTFGRRVAFDSQFEGIIVFSFSLTEKIGALAIHQKKRKQWVVVTIC